MAASHITQLSAVVIGSLPVAAELDTSSLKQALSICTNYGCHLAHANKQKSLPFFQLLDHCEMHQCFSALCGGEILNYSKI